MRKGIERILEHASSAGNAGGLIGNQGRSIPNIRLGMDLTNDLLEDLKRNNVLNSDSLAFHNRGSR